MEAEIIAIHPHAHMLRTLYSDFSLLGDYASDEMVLHQALRGPGVLPIRGLDQVSAYLGHLREATGGAMDAEIESVQANDFFGAVLGVMRLSSPAELAMPFCGLWRFENGLIVEHWENAHDAEAFLKAITSHS